MINILINFILKNKKLNFNFFKLYFFRFQMTNNSPTIDIEILYSFISKESELFISDKCPNGYIMKVLKEHIDNTYAIEMLK